MIFNSNSFLLFDNSILSSMDMLPVNNNDHLINNYYLLNDHYFLNNNGNITVLKDLICDIKIYGTSLYNTTSSDYTFSPHVILKVERNGSTITIAESDFVLNRPIITVNNFEFKKDDIINCYTHMRRTGSKVLSYYSISGYSILLK